MKAISPKIYLKKSKNHIPSIAALVCVSDEVRSRCHIKHNLPKWADTNPNESLDGSNTIGHNVRRQKSWDMLDQNAIAYARQHKNQPHQVSYCLFAVSFLVAYCLIDILRPVLLIQFYNFFVFEF